MLCRTINPFGSKFQENSGFGKEALAMLAFYADEKRRRKCDRSALLRSWTWLCIPTSTKWSSSRASRNRWRISGGRCHRCCFAGTRANMTRCIYLLNVVCTVSSFFGIQKPIKSNIVLLLQIHEPVEPPRRIHEDAAHAEMRIRSGWPARRPHLRTIARLIHHEHQESSDVGLHERTDLIELQMIHYTPRSSFVDCFDLMTERPLIRSFIHDPIWWKIRSHAKWRENT